MCFGGVEVEVGGPGGDVEAFVKFDEGKEKVGSGNGDVVAIGTKEGVIWRNSGGH